MKNKADFSDLATRAASAVVMLAVAGVTIWQGGDIFKALLIIVAALMAWEISRMHDGRAWLPVVAAIAVGGSVFLNLFPQDYLSGNVVLGLRFIPCLLIAFLHSKKSRTVVFIGLLIFIAATSDLGNFRHEQGLSLTLWLLLCVVASDIGGYFAGKMFGGPKLWVRISPKKTWSGTLGGWVLAAGVGTAFVLLADQAAWLILVSVLVAIAAQSGDLAESALKRRAGVKDSSNLIPGHGGLLDRFDGVLGVFFLLGFAGYAGYI